MKMASSVMKSRYRTTAGDEPQDDVHVEDVDLRFGALTHCIDAKVAKDTGRDFCKVGMFTWSPEASTGKLTRESVKALIIGIVSWFRGLRGMKAEVLAVCEEYPSRPGEMHAHLCIVAAEENSHWGALLSHLITKKKIKGNLKLALPNAGKKPENYVLRYLLVPTTKKWKLDMMPQRSTGFQIPEEILEERKKAYKKLTESPASANDVFDLIWRTPSVKSLHDFQVLVDESARNHNDMDFEELDSLPFRRLSRFLNNHSRSKEVVQQAIDRRDLAQHHSGLKMRFSGWMDIAAGKACTCDRKDLFFDQLRSSQSWHDENTTPPNQIRDMMGAWLDGMRNNTFSGREQSLYMKGPPGSGKSTFCQAVLNMIPEFFIGTPCYDSSTPWSGLRKWQLLLDCADFQPTAHLNPSQVLLLLERKEKGINVNVKGQVHFQIAGADLPHAIISSNELVPQPGWKQEQFLAVETRCLMVNLQNALPKSAKILVPGSSALHATCQGCSGRFCSYIVDLRSGSLDSGSKKGHPEPHMNDKPIDGGQSKIVPETNLQGKLKRILESGECPPPPKPKKKCVHSLDDPFGDDEWPSEEPVYDQELEFAMAEIDMMTEGYSSMGP